MKMKMQNLSADAPATFSLTEAYGSKNNQSPCKLVSKPPKFFLITNAYAV